MASLPRLVVWAGVLLVFGIMLAIGNRLQTSVNPFYLIPFYALLLIMTLGIIARRESNSPALIPLEMPAPRWLGVVIGIIALIFNLWIVWGFSIATHGDSGAYIRIGARLFDPSFSGGLTWRTFPILFINFITRSSANPLFLIILQVTLAALAVWALTAILARRNRVLALVIGLFLAFDPVWVSANRTLLTESITISFFILSFAVLLYHLERKRDIPVWQLLFAGLLYTWALFIRPSNLPILALILIAYWITSRSWRQPLVVGLASAGLLVTIIGFNGWRFGEFNLFARSSTSYAGGLFTYRIYAPSNGPASADFDRLIRECHPEVDEQFNGDIGRFLDEKGPVFTVFEIQCGFNKAEVYAALFREAIMRDPLRYLQIIFEENSAMLTFPLREYNALGDYKFFSFEENYATTGQCVMLWCDQPPSVHLTDQNIIIQTIVRVTNGIRQLYLLLPVNPNVPARSNWITRNVETVYSSHCAGDLPCVSLTVTAAWFFVAGFAFITSRGIVRWMVAASFVAIHAIMLPVTITYIFEPRYSMVQAPFYTVISITALVTVAFAVRELASQKSKRPALEAS